MSDIVDRLRRFPLYESHGEESSAPDEAADEIDRLRAEKAELVAALQPFAKEADIWAGYDNTECLVEQWRGGPVSTITVGDLRRARAALAKAEGKS